MGEAHLLGSELVILQHHHGSVNDEESKQQQQWLSLRYTYFLALKPARRSFWAGPGAGWMSIFE